MIINPKNVPQCDANGCEDVAVRNLNADGSVTITKLTSVVNEETIRMRPFSVISFRQVMDSQRFMLNMDPTKRMDQTTAALEPQTNGPKMSEAPITTFTTANDQETLERLTVCQLCMNGCVA